MRLFLVATLLAGCYSGARTSKDINKAWRGHTLGELQAEWGKPARSTVEGEGSVQTWVHTHESIELPSMRGELSIGTGGLDAFGEIKPGARHRSETTVSAYVDANNRITHMAGPSIAWGAHPEANIRWGTVLGMHAGMGRLDDTGTPLPSGGMYIGGMLSSTLALLGSYSLVSGSDEAGGAMGMAWAMAPQWWPRYDVALRAGPAMILAFDPGFENAGLELGVNGAASYALVRSGAFVLDLRLDVSAGTETRFASFGVGVNLN